MVRISEKRSTSHFERNDESLVNNCDSINADESFSIADKFQHAIDTLKQTKLKKEELEKTVSRIKENIERTSSTNQIQQNNVNAMRINQDVIEYDVKSVKRDNEAIQEFGHISASSGFVVWKISDIQEKILDAQSERTTSIYSPPFFTSPMGYRLRIRLYLNGDGTARGSHISIFLVITRGPFDRFLKWPFSYRVVFCLVDQRALLEPEKGGPRDIVDSFRPNIQSVSFVKPCSSMNIASGIPKFIHLTLFNEPMDRNRYRINDTIFIKAHVDFIDLPKSMIPFIFTLDAGLPVHIREKLVSEELERRQRENCV